MPTRERARHDEIEIVPAPNDGTTAGGRVAASCARITTQTTLDRLLRRGLLSKSQQHAQILHDAGERLHEDWHLAGLQPAVTINLFALRGGRGEFTDAQIGARARFNNAMLGLSLTLRDVAYDICCLDYSLRKIEGDRGWQRGTGLAMVRAVLIDLATGYGLLPKNFSLR